MTIDFGARQITTDNTSVRVSASTLDLSDSAYLSAPVSFSTSAGKAVVGGGIWNNTNFSGTTISLLNVNGVPAGAAKLNLQYQNSNYMATGSAQAPRGSPSLPLP